MTKEKYLEILEEASEEHIQGIIFVVSYDSDVSGKELEEVLDEANGILDEIRIAKCEAANDRYNEDLTDDELGLTQM